MALTSDERDLCNQINFEPEVAELLKAATNKPVEQLKGFDLMNGAVVPVAGLSVNTKEEDAQAIFIDLQPQLPAGYTAFCSEYSFKGDMEISVLKTSDRMDIVRLKGTIAGNYDLDNGDIIARLQQWQQLCRFNVIGAGHDWVMLQFETLPADLDAFAQEVYSFCPDTIDQHFGCFGDMADAMDEIGEAIPEELREMVEGLDWSDPDAAGMELLKCWLQNGKSLFLWWD